MRTQYAAHKLPARSLIQTRALKITMRYYVGGWFGSGCPPPHSIVIELLCNGPRMFDIPVCGMKNAAVVLQTCVYCEQSHLSGHDSCYIPLSCTRSPNLTQRTLYAFSQ